MVDNKNTGAKTYLYIRNGNIFLCDICEITECSLQAREGKLQHQRPFFLLTPPSHAFAIALHNNH